MKPWHFIGILLPLLGCSHGSPAEHATRDLSIRSSKVTISVQSDPKLEVQHTAGIKQKVLLDVPLIRQNPELKYGCEVTSLAMILQYAGADTNKMKLFHEIRKDADPLKRSKNGDIISWGNPAEGFVGDMTGKKAGYAVFEQPMLDLIEKYLPGRAVNLTGKDFCEVLARVSSGSPVVIWTTGDYKLPDRPESWTHGKETIRSPMDLHAVVLVGYEGNILYLNDPLSGRKQVAVNKQSFIATWNQMQKRAVSYKQ